MVITRHASVPLVAHISVTALLDALVDADSFTAWTPEELGIGEQSAVDGEEYEQELATARQRSGSAESVDVGSATIDGIPVVVIASDFAFLAGSVGSVACQLVIAAFDRARTLGLPVFASPSSGGTRMQEGTAAFVLMADVAAAVNRFRAGGNPLFVWLRNPTTGGVMATWGSLGTVTFGEPDALAGFLGPRVFEMLSGEQFPTGVQLTNNLAENGVIDGVVALPDLRQRVSAVLQVTQSSDTVDANGAPATPEVVTAEMPHPDPWDAVVRTRDPLRPTAGTLLAISLTNATRLVGTGQGERSDALGLYLAQWNGIGAVVVAQDRAAQNDGSELGPGALRMARRGFALAVELRLPLITIVDTAGAELSVAAEQGGLAGEIARCLSELTTLPVPTVSVLLGMGCGGGALALLPADRVVAAAHAWVSPLPLEGASVIRYRTPDRAADMARSQRVAAWQLAESGIVDVVVPEYPDAAQEPEEFCRRVSDTVSTALADLIRSDEVTRLSTRTARYRGGLDVD